MKRVGFTACPFFLYCLTIQLVSKGTPDRGYRGDFFVLAWHFKVYLFTL